MHPSAETVGKLMFAHYVQSPDQTIVEIGSQLVNGGLRDFAPPGNRYIGLDFVAGPGVDFVMDDPYRFPLADQTADLVVSSSVFEHAEFFWLTFLEALRILKEGGVLYINAPSCGYFHRYPQDCWRFYPDAANALCKWGRRNGFDVNVIETFTAKIEGGIYLNDNVMIFGKGAVSAHPRLCEVVRGYNIGVVQDGLVSEYAEMQDVNQVELFAFELAQGRQRIQRGFPKKPTLVRNDLSAEDVNFLFDYFAHMEGLLKKRDY